MKSTGKSTGPATLGRVPAAHLREDAGLGEIPMFDPTFRALDPGDGNALIAYEETDEKLARLRRLLMRDVRVARSSYRRLMNSELVKWKHELSDWRRTMIRRLKAAIEAKRVKYSYAEISISPKAFRLGSFPELCVTNLWPSSSHGSKLRHRALQRPADFQMLFHCSKYKVNTTYVEAQFAPDGKIARRADTVPDSATGKIWWYLGVDHRVGPVIGWFRHYTKYRRLTAKEKRKLLRDLEKSRWSLVERDEGYVEWLRAHPRPDRGNNAVIFAAWTKFQDAEKQLNQAIRSHQCSHTKVENRSAHYAFNGLVEYAVNLGDDFASGRLPGYCPARADGQTFRYAQQIVYPAFGSGEWTERRFQRFVCVDGVTQRQETTLGSLVTRPNQPVHLVDSGVALELRTAATVKSISLETFDNSWGHPAVMPDPARGRILTTCLRQASKIEGMIFGRESADRLSRSVAECKDLPLMAGQVTQFLAWLASGLPTSMAFMPPARGRVRASLLAAKTARAAAAAWLFWKFGVEPTAHDVNNLCAGTGNYLETLRSGLTSMYRSLDEIRWDMTFKMKTRYSDPYITGVKPQLREREMWIHLPCLPVYPGSEEDLPSGFNIREDGLVALPEDVNSTTDPAVRPFRTCANGTVVLSRLTQESSDPHVYANNIAWIEQLILERLVPICTSTSWKTLDTCVYARFAADDIAAAFGWNGRGLSDLFDVSRALTTSWELMPLAFVADWFLSTREVMKALDVKAFLKTEGLHAEPVDGVWCGHRFLYWNGVQMPDATLTDAWVGTCDQLTAQGIPGIPETWGGRLGKVWAYDACHAGPGSDRLSSTEELEALGNWFKHAEQSRTDSRNWISGWGSADQRIDALKYVIPAEMPILSLKFRISTANKPAVACGSGTCYQRQRIPGALRPLEFVPVLDTRVNVGKLTSLAALIASSIVMPKGMKISPSRVASLNTFHGNSRNPFRRFSYR
jgi:hypothetical protein